MKGISQEIMSSSEISDNVMTNSSAQQLLLVTVCWEQEVKMEPSTFGTYRNIP